MKVNREQFLSILDSVSPAISKKGELEQSECIVLIDGQIMTYNEEMSCSRPSGLSEDFHGAVRCDKLIENLRKWAEDEVDVSMSESHFLVKGKGSRTLGIFVEKEIALPIDAVEKPVKWKSLHPEFIDAVKIVQQCASTDKSMGFALTCVHLHPEWIEAFDNFQLCRWTLETGVKKPTLVRRDSIKHIVSLGMSELSETQGWLHFRNPSGLVLSCRRYLEEYIDITPHIEPSGVKVTLPKGLSEACDKAQDFSKENSESNQVKIELKPGKMKIWGEGTSGFYTETRKVTYSGQPMTFRASPSVLSELVKKHTDCLLSSGRLLVDAGRYVYALHLFVPEVNGQDMNEEEIVDTEKRLEKAKNRQRVEAAEEVE